MLDDLVAADLQNIRTSMDLLNNIGSIALESIEAASRFFEDVAQSFADSSKISSPGPSMTRWIEEAGGDPESVVRDLERATLIGEIGKDDLAGQAHAELLERYSNLARLWMLMKLRKDFFFGLSDFLRLRLISSFGYLRIQSETVALVALAGRDGELAQKWLDPQGGRDFYKKYHSRVVEEMRSSGVYDYFREGSEMALHSRVQGMAPGLVSSEIDQTGKTVLNYQEIGGPKEFLVWFRYYIQAHSLFIDRVRESIPELDYGALKLDEFQSKASALFDRIESLIASHSE